MTREDAKKILQMFQISYPHSYSNMDADEARLFLQLWTDAFKNIPAKAVFDAVKNYIYNTDEKFAPNVGQIRTAIVQFMHGNSFESLFQTWIRGQQLQKKSQSTKSLIQSQDDCTHIEKPEVWHS